MESEVERSLRYGHPLSLILLDVDEFKSYNDRFGHPGGGRGASRQVAQVLSSMARSTDMVARYGGEEFALLLPAADERVALIIAERLRAAIQAAPWPKRAVTASFGVATLREGDQPSCLVTEADEALYRSKEAGRNRVHHADERIEGRFILT